MKASSPFTTTATEFLRIAPNQQRLGPAKPLHLASRDGERTRGAEGFAARGLAREPLDDGVAQGVGLLPHGIPNGALQAHRGRS